MRGRRSSHDSWCSAMWRCAIQRADTDANPATLPETTWLPLIVGNHPEYPSGHACGTAALTESLRDYFGTSTSTS